MEKKTFFKIIYIFKIILFKYCYKCLKYLLTKKNKKCKKYKMSIFKKENFNKFI